VEIFEIFGKFSLPRSRGFRCTNAKANQKNMLYQTPLPTKKSKKSPTKAPKTSAQKVTTADAAEPVAEIACRNCGIFVLTLSEARVVSDTYGHALAAPEPRSNDSTRITPHHNPGWSVNGSVYKTGKVYCARCDNNLGILISTDDGADEWMLKATTGGEGVGFRRPGDPLGEARAPTSKAELQTSLVDGVGGLLNLPRRRCVGLGDEGAGDLSNLTEALASTHITSKSIRRTRQAAKQHENQRERAAERAADKLEAEAQRADNYI